MGRKNIDGGRGSPTTSDDGQSAEQIAAAAAKDAFAKADEGADGAMERARRNQEAADQLVDGLAEAIAAGFDRSACESYLSEFSKKTRGGITKTNLKEMLEELTAAADSSGAKKTDEVVREATVTEIRSTDHNQTTKYRWDFGDHTVVSNGSGQGRYHLSEQEFAKEIVASGGELPIKTNWDNDQWLRFISDHIRSNATVREVVGDKTEVVEKLRDHVEESEAFAPIEVLDALEGVFVPQDDGPTRGDTSEVWVPSEIVVGLVDDSPLDSSSELYLELDAREAIPTRMSSGVREQTHVGGIRRTFWVLRRDFAEPRDYTLNPLDYDDPSEYFSAAASDSLSRVSNKNDDTTDDDTTEEDDK